MHPAAGVKFGEYDSRNKKDPTLNMVSVGLTFDDGDPTNTARLSRRNYESMTQKQLALGDQRLSAISNLLNASK